MYRYEYDDKIILCEHPCYQHDMMMMMIKRWDFNLKDIYCSAGLHLSTLDLPNIFQQSGFKHQSLPPVRSMWRNYYLDHYNWWLSQPEIINTFSTIAVYLFVIFLWCMPAENSTISILGVNSVTQKYELVTTVRNGQNDNKKGGDFIQCRLALNSLIIFLNLFLSIYFRSFRSSKRAKTSPNLNTKHKKGF